MCVWWNATIRRPLFPCSSDLFVWNQNESVVMSRTWPLAQSMTKTLIDPVILTLRSSSAIAGPAIAITSTETW